MMLNPRHFYLGAPEPAWLGRTTVPLFVSYGRLNRLVAKLPRSPWGGRWALDSRGFSELKDHGRWTITPEQYVEDVHRYDEEIGNLEWAAPQDSMCEEAIIRGGVWGGQRFAGTLRPGETLESATQRNLYATVENYLRLRELWPATGSSADNPFMLVLQGRDEEHYHQCWDLYESAGVNVSNVEVVGVGSVCRRQSTKEIGRIMASLQARDPEHALPIHGFGVKTDGLGLYGDLLSSADSQSWSINARLNKIKNPGCVATHSVCSYCLTHAESWRERMLDSLNGDLAA